ncbi:hypothetical protein HN011_004488 [Eciton burchellii]|nr:hypothetical protein HN011_004488 [Eciton burchellii]
MGVQSKIKNLGQQSRDIRIRQLKIHVGLKTHKDQLNKLYMYKKEQQCALEKQILQNTLSLSSTALDEMAFRIMKTTGYTAVTAGEMVHLIKCIPVECRARQTNECHKELQDTYQTYFHTPRSRIVIESGIPRDCVELLPIIYKVHDSWFLSMPGLPKQYLHLIFGL